MLQRAAVVAPMSVGGQMAVIRFPPLGRPRIYGESRREMGVFPYVRTWPGSMKSRVGEILRRTARLGVSQDSITGGEINYDQSYSGSFPTCFVFESAHDRVRVRP